MRDTSVRSEEVGLGATDFGVYYWMSHHPWIVPEPCTLEPTESYSKADLDQYIEIIRFVSDEAYTNSELVKSTPYNSTVNKIDLLPLDDLSQWVVNWKAYRKKICKETE